MSQILKRKVEKAFCAYLAPLTESGQSLAGMNIYAGSGRDSIKLPCVVVAANKATERTDIVTGSGVYDVTLQVQVQIQVDDSGVDISGEMLEVILNKIYDIDAVKAFMNREAGADLRPVKDLYIYAVEEQEEEDNRADRRLSDILSFRIVCQGIDPDPVV